MSKKQQIAEAERRFENWWKFEGAENLYLFKHRLDWNEVVLHKSLLKEAWMSGAFAARENN